MRQFKEKKNGRIIIVKQQVEQCEKCGSTTSLSRLFRAGKHIHLCVVCLFNRGISQKDVASEQPKSVPAQPRNPRKRNRDIPELLNKLAHAFEEKEIKTKYFQHLDLVQCLTSEFVTKSNWRKTLRTWNENGCPDFNATSLKLIFDRKHLKKRKSLTPVQPSIKLQQKQVSKTNYADYLASDLWYAIRRFVLLQANHNCKACGKRANQVHHRSYESMTMRGRDVSKLVAICERCHKFIEFDESGEKTSLKEANTRLDDLIISYSETTSDLDREFREIMS
mgnify:FL=1